MSQFGFHLGHIDRVILAVAVTSVLAVHASPVIAHEPSNCQANALASPRGSLPVHQDVPVALASLPHHGAAELVVPEFDPSTLPTIDEIDAQTDIAAFLQSCVPNELRIAALRRFWSVSPAIRDFKGLNENDWDFNELNSIPGFGVLGPDADVQGMVAEILPAPLRVAARR